jgi:hypothetical protein
MTIGVLYPRYHGLPVTTQKYGYDYVPFSGKRLRNQVHHTGHGPTTPSRARGLSVPGKQHWSRVLEKQRHLMFSTIGCDHRLLRILDHRHLSNGICPVTA